MNKREFIKNLGLGSAAVLGAPILFQSCESESENPEDFKLWIWTGGGEKSEADWDKEFEGLKQLGFYGVLVGGGKPVLEKAIPAAQKHDLEIHAWQWTMNRPGDKTAQEHPEWYAVSREGNSSFDVRPYVDYYQWLCPTKPEVQEFVYNGMMKVAELEGLNGVQLDYVRYCDVILPKGLWSKYDLVQDHEMPEFDFCYCEDCRTKFKSEQGYDPLDLEDPSKDEKWRQFRLDSITNLVNKIADGVHQKGKKLSASVFATPSLARMMVRQDWDKWNLDFVFPMIYYKFYDEDIDFMKRATEEGLNDLNGSKPLYTAFYLADKNEEEVSEAVKLVKDTKANGMAFYDYGLLNESFQKTITEALKG